MVEAISWPLAQHIPNAVKTLIVSFYKLADSNAEDTPDKMARLFTEDGTMYTLAGVSKGTQAIVTSRKNSWNGIAKRQHEVLKVYTFNETSNDLLLIGKICADLTNGRTVEMEFIGQFILTGDVESDPQIVSYKSWGDTAPWAKAMSG